MVSALAQNTLRELELFTLMYCANVLIIGEIPRSARDDVLHTMKRHTGFGMFHAQRSAAFDLPSHRNVVLVLDDACELSSDHQVRLLEWVSRNHVQIVSFASRSLYAMVCAEKFIDRLYYQLNTVCIIAGDS